MTDKLALRADILPNLAAFEDEGQSGGSDQG